MKKSKEKLVETITPPVETKTVETKTVETKKDFNNGTKQENLNDAFSQFENKMGEFTPENGEGTVLAAEAINETPTEKKEVTPTLEQQVKIKMFVGFACFLLAGLNTFLLNKVRKSRVPTDKMYLSKEEQETLLPYLNSQEVLDFIDKLPTWLIAVCHIEFMFWSKHSEHVDEYKIKVVDEDAEEIVETKTKTKKL